MKQQKLSCLLVEVKLSNLPYTFVDAADKKCSSSPISSNSKFRKEHLWNKFHNCWVPRVPKSLVRPDLLDAKSFKTLQLELCHTPLFTRCLTSKLVKPGKGRDKMGNGFPRTMARILNSRRYVPLITIQTMQAASDFSNYECSPEPFARESLILVS